MYYLSDVVCSSTLAFSLGVILASLLWRKVCQHERRALEDALGAARLDKHELEKALIASRSAYAQLAKNALNGGALIKVAQLKTDN